MYITKEEETNLQKLTLKVRRIKYNDNDRNLNKY